MIIFILQMDFETAARNAARSVFPGSEWKGCFFHFTQCIWRRTQYHGLQEDYRTRDDINQFLPLVPVQEVNWYFRFIFICIICFDIHNKAFKATFFFLTIYGLFSLFRWMTFGLTSSPARQTMSDVRASQTMWPTSGSRGISTLTSGTTTRLQDHAPTTT